MKEQQNIIKKVWLVKRSFVNEVVLLKKKIVWYSNINIIKYLAAKIYTTRILQRQYLPNQLING
jgi:hypothetical protein